MTPRHAVIAAKAAIQFELNIVNHDAAGQLDLIRPGVRQLRSYSQLVRWVDTSGIGRGGISMAGVPR